MPPEKFCRLSCHRFNFYWTTAPLPSLPLRNSRLKIKKIIKIPLLQVAPFCKTVSSPTSIPKLFTLFRLPQRPPICSPRRPRWPPRQPRQPSASAPAPPPLPPRQPGSFLAGPSSPQLPPHGPRPVRPCSSLPALTTPACSTAAAALCSTGSGRGEMAQICTACDGSPSSDPRRPSCSGLLAALPSCQRWLPGSSSPFQFCNGALVVDAGSVGGRGLGVRWRPSPHRRRRQAGIAEQACPLVELHLQATASHGGSAATNQTPRS
jgi:hypothetical protein